MTHLRGHNLNEPKMAIRKHGIVSGTLETVMSSEDHHQLPIEEWNERENTWLPDGALSGEDVPLQTSESTAELSSL